MKTYFDLVLVAFITIYIVDLSGFTDSWRSLLSGLLKIKSLRPLPPFDCGLCMTWWVCILYSLITKTFSLQTLAFIACLSYLSLPIGQTMIFIKEGFLTLIRKLNELC